MVALQRGNCSTQFHIRPARQCGKDVQFLVLVVKRGRNIEITQHVGCGRAGRCVVSVGVNVRHQPAQQVQRAVDTFVASLQHLERLLETDRWRAEARQ